MSKETEGEETVEMKPSDVISLAKTFASRYQLKKKNWYGTYSRVFCIGTNALLTLNPTTLLVTNLWEHDLVLDITPKPKSDEEFTMTAILKRGTKKTKTYSFSSSSRADLLCDVARLKFQTLNKDDTLQPKGRILQAPGVKLKRSREKRNVLLVVLPFALCQAHAGTGKIFQILYFHKITRIVRVSDSDGAFVVFYGVVDERVYIFNSSERDKIVDTVLSESKTKIGYNIPTGGTSGVVDMDMNYVLNYIKNLESDDQVYNTLGEFHVQKITPRRHADPQQRIVTISDKWLVERHPSTYAVVTIRPLRGIVAVVRPVGDPQAVQIVYRDGIISSYVCSYRDYFLTTLLDCCNSCGIGVSVSSSVPRRGLALTPLAVPIDSQTESQLIAAIADFNMKDHAASKDNGLEFFGFLVATFNSNVPYTGLLHLEHHCQYKNTITALSTVLNICSTPSYQSLQCIRRLVTSRPGFEALSDNTMIREKIFKVLENGLASSDDLIVYSSLDVFNVLLYPRFNCQNQKTTDDSNKYLLLANANLINLFFKVFSSSLIKGTSALNVLICIDTLVLILCDSYSDTTKQEHFDMILVLVAGIGRDLFKLFHATQCLSVVRGAGMIMKAIIEEGFENEGLIENLQSNALVEGATLRHLHSALFTKNTTSRQIIHKGLSSVLVALWTSGSPLATEMLSRTFPQALVDFLSSTEVPPEESIDGEEILKQKGVPQQSIFKSFLMKWQTRDVPKRGAFIPRVHRQSPHSQTLPNWAMLLYQARQDHARADLIWNNHTREELRETLETEMRVFRQEQEIAASGGVAISWNHKEFIVPYDCLKGEICVGGYFLRLLLHPPAGQKAPPLRNPAEFFDMLFHRCLLEQDVDRQCLAIQALTVVQQYYSAKLPVFRDIGHLVTMLAHTTLPIVRDRIVQCIAVLTDNIENAKLFIDANGIQVLCDLLTLVHFQAEHIIAPKAANLITAPQHLAQGEWYYTRIVKEDPETQTTPQPSTASGLKLEKPEPKKEKIGPVNLSQLRAAYRSGDVTPSSLCWCQGLADWTALSSIPQLKWALLASQSSILTNYELGALVLDIFIKLVQQSPLRDETGGIIRPLPRAKRLLVSSILLPHVVQVCLTLDNVLVNKTAALLALLLQDNLAALPKLYLTGVYYFLLLYSGSDFLQISKFLKETHLAQNFLDLKGSSSLEHLSILGPLLPPAMVHLLDRRGYDEFSHVFLGKYDTPEAIWDGELRKHLCDQLSVHLGNFPLRLHENPKALYQYVPIPPIKYKEIDKELFCSHYYLRNLCDLNRFPSWPISNEVELLAAVLAAWEKEDEKPPQRFTREEALKVLGLNNGYKEEELRRAYFKMAQKYHPDKNPEGRDIFEQINAAYTFLNTTSGEEEGNTTRDRVLLLIKTQTLLYTRFQNTLSAYKYAGYPLVIKAISNAELSKDSLLLRNCVELCYRTLKCTALNVGELNRQGGIEKIVAVLQNSVQALNTAKSAEDLQCVITFYCLLCVSVAALNRDCHEILCKSLQTWQDVCIGLQFKLSPKVEEAALECVCCASLNKQFQELLFERNALYLLVPHLFKYDHTLEEQPETGGPPTVQSQHNMNAVLSLVSLSRFGGRDPAADVSPLIQKCVDALLTKKVTSTLCKRPMLDVLKDLNGNICTPLFIWDNRTRGEVLSYIEDKLSGDKSASTFSSDIDGQVQKAVPNHDCSSFKFPSLEREVLVGDVYVRVFNLQVKFHNTLPDTKGFVVALTKYIAEKHEVALQKRESEESDEEKKNENRQVASHLASCAQPPSIVQLEMCTKALANALRANTKLEYVLAVKQAMEMIMKPFVFVEELELIANLIEVVSLLGRNNECVNCLGETESYVYLLPVLLLRGAKCTAVVLSALNLLHGLMVNNKIVFATYSGGGMLYLLRIFCSATERGGDTMPRAKAAEIISKMAVDLAHGTLVSISLKKFLPSSLVHAIKHDTDNALQLFESSHDNPDLIWNNGTRTEIRAFLEKKCKEFYVRQKEKPTLKFSLPEDFKMEYEELKDEVVIGGVYIRNFLKQPTWPLSEPKVFTEAVLDCYITTLSSPSSSSSSAQATDGDASSGQTVDLTQLKVSAKTAQALFLANVHMCDHAAKTGHVAKLFSLIESPSVPKHSSLLLLISVLMTSELCVETAERLQSVRALISILRTNPKLAQYVCEAFEKMFTKNVCTGTICFAKQLLETSSAIKVLMKILDGSGDSVLGDKATETKARLVTGLQALCKEELHGVQLLAQLEEYPAWKTFGKQRHDLFITAGQGPIGLLTGPTSGGIVGLLTDSAHNTNLPDAPPEL